MYKLITIIILILNYYIIYINCQSFTQQNGDDWFIPSYVQPLVNSGLFSENTATDQNVNVGVFDIAWKQINPSKGTYVYNLTATVKGMPFDTFANQNNTNQPFWMRIWNSGDLWAPSWIKSYCNVGVIGKDYDNEWHLPIWNDCVWGEIKAMYRYIYLEKGMRSDPRLKLVYIPGAFNWCEFDFGIIGNYSQTTGYTYTQFNTWFQQAMQDLVNIFNGENNDPTDDYSYKLVYTGEDYPFDVDFWSNSRNFLARDAVSKGMGIRTGITELSNFHLSEIPAYGTIIDKSSGYMVSNYSWPLLSNPNGIIATENECYTTCGFSVAQANLFYAIKMSNLKALQMNVNWLYVVKTDSYLVQYATHWNWVRLSLGRRPNNAFDAWAALRTAQDTFWNNNNAISFKNQPWVRNYERFLTQRDQPTGITKNGSLVYNKILDPTNGMVYEGLSTNLASSNPNIFFYLDDGFMFGQQTNFSIKVTYLDKVASSWKIVYMAANNTQQSTSTVTVGTSGNQITATFNFDSATFSNSIDYSSDFKIVNTGSSDIEVYFVRVIKLGNSGGGSTPTTSTSSITGGDPSDVSSINSSIHFLLIIISIILVLLFVQ